MNNKRKPADSIPATFSSYEEAAEFWDTHDTTDYPTTFQTVHVETDLRRRRYEIEVDEDVMAALRKRAKKQKISVNSLASSLLRNTV